MNFLGVKAAKTFCSIVSGLCEPGDNRRIGDGSNGYMPLSVECIEICSRGLMYSLAHYSEQNGDLMRDPEMTFLHNKDGEILPLSYRNDFVGVDQIAVALLEDSGWKVNEKLNENLCSSRQIGYETSLNSRISNHKNRAIGCRRI